MYNKQKIALVSLLSICLISSCDSKSFISEFITRNMTYVEFDKPKLIEDVSTNVIIPEYKKFYDLSKSFNEKTNIFINNPDNISLKDLQDNWKKIMESWQKINVFEFGPVKTLSLHSKIFYSPINTQAINEVISKPVSELSNNFLNTVGVTKKGLPVIEYLIFANDSNAVIESFNSNDLSKNSEQRKIYLQLLSKDLLDNSEKIYKEWDTNQGNYSAKLVKENNAFNMLLNNTIAVLENIKDTKLGTPMGKKSGGELRLNEIESIYSNNAKNNILNNILSLEAIFKGSYTNSELNGLDDYLDYMERKDLRIQIVSQIDKVKQMINGMNPSLEYTITKENTKAENLYNEIKELLRLMKVDTANSVNETVTFNSSDGD